MREKRRNELGFKFRVTLTKDLDEASSYCIFLDLVLLKLSAIYLSKLVRSGTEPIG